MNVAEMIEWLKTMPQNAEVEVIIHSSGGGYYQQGGTATNTAMLDTVDSRYDYEGRTDIDGQTFTLTSYGSGPVLTLGLYNN